MKWLMVAAVLFGIGLIGILVIPFDSRLDESSIGSLSGPGYTWLGDMPLEDPMESRWYDKELVNPYSVKPGDIPAYRRTRINPVTGSFMCSNSDRPRIQPDPNGR